MRVVVSVKCFSCFLYAECVASQLQSMIDVPGVTDTLFSVMEYIHSSQTGSSDGGLGEQTVKAIVSVLLAFPSLPLGSNRHANSKVQSLLRGVSVDDCNKVINVFGNGEYPPFSLSLKY